MSDTSKQQQHIDDALPQARKLLQTKGKAACRDFLTEVASDLPDNSEEAQMRFFTDWGNKILRGL